MDNHSLKRAPMSMPIADSPIRIPSTDVVVHTVLNPFEQIAAVSVGDGVERQQKANPVVFDNRAEIILSLQVRRPLRWTTIGSKTHRS